MYKLGMNQRSLSIAASNLFALEGKLILCSDDTFQLDFFC